MTSEIVIKFFLFRLLCSDCERYTVHSNMSKLAVYEVNNHRETYFFDEDKRVCKRKIFLEPSFTNSKLWKHSSIEECHDDAECLEQLNTFLHL